MNASSNAPVSPPSSRRRLAATREDATAAASSSVGAVTWNRSERAARLGPEVRDAVGVRSHRPGVDVARLDRDEPRVGAEERRQLRGAREAVDTVREQHGGGLRRVVPQRPGDERRRLRLDEGREGRVGVEPGPADLDQAERRLRRDRPRAGDPQHLAVRRHAAARQAAGEEVDVAAEPVRGPQIDEAAVDLRLAIEHRPRWLAARTRDERGRDGSVERAPRPAEGTEPRHLERAVGRRKGGRRLGERPVLDDEPPAEHRCDRRRAGDDPDRDEREALAPGAEPRPGQPERKGKPPQAVHRHERRLAGPGPPAQDRTGC